MLCYSRAEKIFTLDEDCQTKWELFGILVVDMFFKLCVVGFCWSFIFWFTSFDPAARFAGKCRRHGIFVETSLE